MSVLCLALVFTFLFTACFPQLSQWWIVPFERQHTLKVVFLSKTRIRLAAVTANGHQKRDADLKPITTRQQVTIISTKSTFPRDDLRRQTQSVTPPADAELCSQVNQQVQIQPSKKSVTPTFKAGHDFIERAQQKQRVPLLWKQICRWGSCLWDMLNSWLTRKWSSSNTGRENMKERKTCGQINQAVFVSNVNWYKMMLG